MNVLMYVYIWFWGGVDVFCCSKIRYFGVEGINDDLIIQLLVKFFVIVSFWR